MVRLLRVLLLAVWIVFVPGAARAATRTVCASGCDFTTIAAAIADAATVNGDTIQVSAGTYTETVSVSKNLTISGAGPTTTIVQAQASYCAATTVSVFNVPAANTVTLKNMTVRYGCNPADGYGGGVDNAGVATLDSLIVERGIANQGGGVANRTTGTLTLKSSIIRNNPGGGGVWNGGIMTIQNSTIMGNGSGGGGVYAYMGTLTMSGSVIASNSSYGLTVNNTSSVTATNVTISDNTNGSGILAGGGTLKMSFCTIARNDNPAFAGGITYSNSSYYVVMKNTILADNTMDGVPYDCDARADSYGHVMIGTLRDCALSIYGDGDVFEQESGLDYLRDNGGPTTTNALLDNSPAIDGGDCVDLDGATVTTDQRGVSRPQGTTCDIGAYEADGSVSSGKFGCWDLNENGACDSGTEDKNGDNNCTPQDCQGEDGVACWDLNGDHTCNIGSEDLNDDNACDLLDCRGSTGPAGVACWDLNSNKICDTAEDKNTDTTCNVEDCQGAAGFSCWDLDGDYVCDAGENKNNDGDCTVLDCQGTSGTAGTPGAAGTACWDLNANSACNLPSEDPSGDNQCTVLDCRGAAGTDGYACWDLNQNHICDAAEDKSGDVACSVVDCQGQDGYTCWDTNSDYTCDPNEDTNGDNTCTVADCQGPEGPTGPTGVTCWDLNANQTCDIGSEDLDGDVACTLADCRGADGLDGFTCWDLNTNRICDASEDGNGDTLCNVLDCKGLDGADGADGTNGADGANGLSCWDLDSSGVCDPNEDVNDDGACDVLDCTGIDGVSALSRVSDEPAGSHCAAGGVKIETGIDLDGDAALSDAEVQETRYACNGVPGPTQVASGDDGGCGCRTTRAQRSPGLWALAVLGVALGLRRREKRSSAKSRSSVAN